MKRKTLSITLKQSTRLSAVCFIAFTALLVINRGLLEAAVLILSYIVHEAFHLIAAFMLGINIKGASSALYGVSMVYNRADLKAGTSALLFLAGPFGNIAFAVGIYLASTVQYVPNAEFFVFYNISLAMLNMIPAYPLDAARAIEAVLRIWLSSLKAIKIVCTISYMSCTVLFCYGSYMFLYRTDNFLLLMLAAFLYMSSVAEYSAAEMDTLAKIAQEASGICSLQR
ncbi:MAG: hypothetical protein FWG30_02780 [Eubacteriaceae bacterium]|nr:hypothetical protein [Eubacteriaceae bacterium]